MVNVLIAYARSRRGPDPGQHDGAIVAASIHRGVGVADCSRGHRRVPHRNPGGHPTDASHDYTDWDAVEDFARAFAANVRRA
jgi:menaquinone-dependent protoporphyrinogen IX oxidase